MTPMPFDFLRLIAGRPEMIYDFQHGFRQPLGRYFPPIIKL